MGDKPFKIGPQPRSNTNARTSVVKEPYGVPITRSQRTGDPLPADKAMPRDAVIAWPAAGGPDDKNPTKNMR